VRVHKSFLNGRRRGEKPMQAALAAAVRDWAGESERKVSGCAKEKEEEVGE
jgi:hypothetical protein